MACHGMVAGNGIFAAIEGYGYPASTVSASSSSSSLSYDCVLYRNDNDDDK